ncbi:EAL domain-containing protein [Thiomicrorhabdus sp. 6S3-12]|uniref:bifunctional diguanylate cyclase/phosphodiesterase n=1 Tax=Thiomicrorhabdus sp. 6S3-12 TaxID=2819681 RepID=UPI001AAD5C69|nr:EAL domain-containing protein [Thiomicrorhabdus sp. 6S3-12]MBO1924648.1 EAL domain-containing protein [Thiomicrorhabdus sp. 6S3-12]
MKWFVSLANRINISIAAVLSLLLFLLILNINDSITSFSNKEQKNVREQFSEFLNSALAPLLFNQDYASLVERMNQLIKDHPGLDHIEVLNIDNRRIAHVDNLGKDTQEPHNGTQFAQIELRLADELVGHLVYSLSLQQYGKLKQELRQEMVFLTTLAILLTIILTTLLMGFLTKGLRKLTHASQKMLNGDYQSPIPFLGHDEIGRLGQSFDELRESIQRRTHLLELEQSRMESLLNTMNVGILFENSDGLIEYHNQTFFDIWRLNPSISIYHQPLENVLKRSPLKVLSEQKIDARQVGERRYECQLSDGRIILQTQMDVEEKQTGGGNLWVFEDITQQKELEEELTTLATYDPLTGLNNRHGFKQQIFRMSSFAKRRNQFLALLFFDLDEFKLINDTFGHARGDETLILVANTMRTHIRKEEWLFRLGGDEFALLSIVSDQRQAEFLAERIIDALANTPHQFGSQQLRITTSIGISFYPHPSADPEMLPSHADIAMYEAKERGKNTYTIYNPRSSRLDREMARLSWAESINKALNQNKIELHFQGVYHIQDQKLRHLEALVRIRDEENKLVHPNEFIPIAEKNGQIVEIDRYVIHRSIEMLAQNPNIPDIAINLSGRSFDDVSLPDYIAKMIAFYQVKPQRLLFELTETETVADIQDASQFIDALHDIGCTVCLDDFGTGFASFAYLKHLKVDVLKIDGTFIQNLDTSMENRLFVESMVTVAKGLGKRTIAEFIESEAILETCRELGVDMGQGYYLDKPQKTHPSLGNIHSELHWEEN